MRHHSTTEPFGFKPSPSRALAILIFLLDAAAMPMPAFAADGGSKGVPESLRIEILPGEREKLIDPALGGRVPVVVLGTTSINVRELDPASFVLAGAAVAKNDDGSLANYRDVNGDGLTDLIVSFPTRQIHLGDRSTRAVLSGRTSSGGVVFGTGAVATVESTRSAWRLAARVGHNEGKLPPIPVAIDVMPHDAANRIELGNRGTVAVAVLSERDFDATKLDPRAVSLAGARVTRRESGGLATFEDMNGDGLADLVVEVPKRFLKLERGATQALLTGLTPEGRSIRGVDAVAIADTATMTLDSEDPVAGPQPHSVSFANTASIAINDNTTATPYPSQIVVSGLTGVVSKVRVTLRSLTHTFPNDIDILLVGPTGQNLILMSDVVGEGPGVSLVDLTLDDDASTPLDSVNNPSSGTYRPANFDDGIPDTFPGPAPGPSDATTLSAFNGTNPNGAWSLYVVDDTVGDSGSIGGGWQLDFVMASEFCSAGSISIPDATKGVPYPATVPVAGLTGIVSKVTAVFKQFSHTAPRDVDALLVSPGGLTSMVLSDTAGANPGVSNVNLVIDTNAALTFDPAVNPASGTYQPSDNLPGDSLPSPAPAAPYAGTLDVFQGANPNGTWNLWVADDTALDSGSIGAFCLDITVLSPVDGVDPSAFTIPAGAPGVTMGKATPYPARIDVTGALGTLSKTTVTLRGLTHTSPRDLDILLAAPTGKNVMLMSDVGGGAPGASGVNYTFSDDASSSIPTLTNVGTGSYKPTNDDSGGTDSMPAPAPAGPYGATLSGLSSGGAGPNGPWFLYVNDDKAGDVGSIASGWTLSVQTFLPNAGGCNMTPITIPVGAPGVTSGPASVYPSSSVVVGFPVDLTQYKVKVDLRGLSHTSPNDLDVLLVGPQGQTVMLMSDAGGGAPGVGGVNLSILDDAPASFSSSVNPVSGSYRPTDFTPGDVMPAPAPAGPYASSLSAFEGTSALGSWALYIADDTTSNVGSLTGWCLNFVTSNDAGQVPHLRWDNKTTIAWDAGNNATSYNVYRGVPSALASLTNQNIDSCLRGTTLTQQLASVTEVPAAGTLFWYLALGKNAQGEGPPGFNRLAGAVRARLLNSSGNCP